MNVFLILYGSKSIDYNLIMIKNNLNILRWDDIANTDEMIDYIFYKSSEDHEITILDYKINKTLYNKSDHLPIEFTIAIK